MNLKDLGDKVKAKFNQYKDYASEEIGKLVTEKYPVYKEKITQSLEKDKQYMAELGEIENRYGPSVKMGVLMTPEKTKARRLNEWLAEKELPGQVLTNALAQRTENSEAYQAAQKAKMGAYLTPRERKVLEKEGMMFVMGLTSGMQDVSGKRLAKSRLTPKGRGEAANIKAASKSGYNWKKGADADFEVFKEAFKRDPSDWKVQTFLDKYKGFDDRFADFARSGEVLGVSTNKPLIKARSRLKEFMYEPLPGGDYQVHAVPKGSNVIESVGGPIRLLQESEVPMSLRASGMQKNQALRLFNPEKSM